MKISLNDYCELVVTPENAIERFALQEWARRREASDSNARFIIETRIDALMPPRPAPAANRKEY